MSKTVNNATATKGNEMSNATTAKDIQEIIDGAKKFLEANKDTDPNHRDLGSGFSMDVLLIAHRDVIERMEARLADLYNERN